MTHDRDPAELMRRKPRLIYTDGRVAVSRDDLSAPPASRPQTPIALWEAVAAVVAVAVAVAVSIYLG